MGDGGSSTECNGGKDSRILSPNSCVNVRVDMLGYRLCCHASSNTLPSDSYVR